jgi:two-component system, chemotaxis family, sensor kinase CheA
VSERDPELDRLLGDEIERRLPTLAASDTTAMDLRAALHALKGSAAMAGYSELALVIGQLGERVRAGRVDARSEAHETLGTALARLRSGKTPFATAWPEPPPPLEASHVDPRFAVEYHAAMRDRLLEIDRLLAGNDEHATLLEHALRTLHTMKGAAAAVGDDVVAWYCHGLETRLRGTEEGERTPRDVLTELSRDRVLLALLIDDGARGLETLRTVTGGSRVRRPSPPSRPPSAIPGSFGKPTDEELALRVGPAALDRLVDRLEGVDAIGDDLAAAATVAARMSTRLSGVRHNVLDALRRIGPARPWGPPSAALAELEAAGDTLRRAAVRANIAAVTFRGGSNLVRTRARDLREGLAALRRTSMGWVFERVGRAVLRFAEQQGKLVNVQISGAEVAVDRVLAEQVVDAVLQLAKNAVAHGIQTPERREGEGKPPTGTIWLRAARDGGFLRVQVEDDGRGADVERIREVAVARGFASAELLSKSAPSDLMGLLLLPGMTTRPGADLLAGRGIGLEVVQAAARRFGGAVRLQNRDGGGLIATLELPSDQGVVEVLWIEDRATTYALPVSYVGRVLPGSATPPTRLSVCLGERPADAAPLELELTVLDSGPIRIGVERALTIELASLRALPPRIASSGPFAGAVLRPDGSLVLALDGPALAARARVLLGGVRRADAGP